MKNENEFMQIVADNLIYYRKLNNLTQLELSEKLNYSDKSISKWERKEGLPDLYTLYLIADLYGITIDQLLEERKEPPKVQKPKLRTLILLISIGLCWLIATIAFVSLALIEPYNYKIWLPFIYAIPVSMIVVIVFSKIWHKRLLTFLATSLLNWTVPLSVLLSINYHHLWLLFIISIPMQILIILWFYLRKHLKKTPLD